MLYLTIEPQPIPLSREVGREQLPPLLDQRGIELQTKQKITKIDPEAKTMTIEGKEEPVPYDLMIATWPQKAPKVLEPLGLNDLGFLPADNSTFETKHKGIYAIGDCAHVILPNSETFEPNIGKPTPFPKTGELAKNFARFMAKGVIKEFEKRLTGKEEPSEEVAKELKEAWENVGKFKCGLEFGNKEAAMMYVDLNLHPESTGPKFNMAEPTKQAWEDFHQYWNDSMNYWFARQSN